MDRRRFALALSAAVAAPGVYAGPSTPRIGFLSSTAISEGERQAFRTGLREHGYVEGKNVTIEWRSTDGRAERADVLAVELVKSHVELIVTALTPAAKAAQKATRTIPIVMAYAGDPVETGLVQSLARPGGNITGLSASSAELGGKRLAQVRRVVPGLKKVALLINSADPFAKPFVDESREPARRLGIELEVFDAASGDVDRAFTRMKQAGVGAVVVQGVLMTQAAKIAKTALHYRLPTASPQKQLPRQGGLMSYGADLDDLIRRSAAYVDKILKGARPAELPVEQPTKFELVLNLRTAQQLGIKVSDDLLASADEIIRR